MSRGYDGWATFRATQKIWLNFSLKSALVLSGGEAESINNKILAILSTRAKCSSDFDIEEFYDGELNESGENLEAGEEFEITVIANINVSGRYYYSPATMYDSHGDPGSPEESDFEPQEGYIDTIDASAVLADLKKIPKFGDAIDDDTFSCKVSDDFDIDDDYTPDYDDGDY